MLPPAPGRLSMTTGWPHASVSFCPIARATTSSEPPAGKGTTRRIGLVGYACAVATVGIIVAAATSTAGKSRLLHRAKRHGPSAMCGSLILAATRSFEFALPPRAAHNRLLLFRDHLLPSRMNKAVIGVAALLIVVV